MQNPGVDADAGISYLCSPSLLPPEILYFYEELPLGLFKSVRIPEIRQVVRRSGVADRERIQLVAEQGVDLDGLAEFIILPDKTEKDIGTELIDSREPRNISIIKKLLMFVA